MWSITNSKYSLIKRQQHLTKLQENYLQLNDYSRQLDEEWTRITAAQERATRHGGVSNGVPSSPPVPVPNSIEDLQFQIEKANATMQSRKAKLALEVFILQCTKWDEKHAVRVEQSQFIKATFFAKMQALKARFLGLLGRTKNKIAIRKAVVEEIQAPSALRTLRVRRIKVSEYLKLGLAYLTTGLGVGVQAVTESIGMGTQLAMVPVSLTVGAFWARSWSWLGSFLADALNGVHFILSGVIDGVTLILTALAQLIALPGIGIKRLATKQKVTAATVEPAVVVVAPVPAPAPA